MCGAQVDRADCNVRCAGATERTAMRRARPGIVGLVLERFLTWGSTHNSVRDFFTRLGQCE